MRRLVVCCVAFVFLLAAADQAHAGRWRYADPRQLGLYPVGHSVFDAVEPARDDRRLRVEMWYPADPFLVVARNRPLDVLFLIDLMLARSRDPNDEFYAKINARALGVAGHSFGGFTALAAASGFHVPAEGIDIPPDPRVRAIVPASGILSDLELQSIHLPVLFVSGTFDTTTPIETQTTRPWALIPSRPFYRVDIVGATHLQFANVCDIGQALLDFGVDLAGITRLGIEFVDTCLPPALDIGIVRDAENLYVTAFLKKHLLNDSRYDSFLTPEYAATNQLGVVFQRQEEAP